jgi:hypothetical protein
MHCFLAGWQASNTENELRLVKSGAITHRCFSFANMVQVPGLPYFLPGTEEGYQVCMANGVGIMMDSGVFSYRTHKKFLTKSGKGLSSLPTDDEYVQMYVKFCKKWAHKWSFYVTVDFGIVAEDNFRRHKLLEKMGIRPVPVYHGDEGLEYLGRYKDRGYDYICIGTALRLRSTVKERRRYLDGVFEYGAKHGIAFHGLAVTTSWMILAYPWRSVDSSSWSRAAGYGNIIRFNESTGRIETIHVSSRTGKFSQYLPLRGMAFAKQLRRALEDEGYDFHELQTSHVERHEYNAFTMQKLAAVGGSGYNGGSWRGWLDGAVRI